VLRGDRLRAKISDELDAVGDRYGMARTGDADA
jgi:hypothetical protein